MAELPITPGHLEAAGRHRGAAGWLTRIIGVVTEAPGAIAGMGVVASVREAHLEAKRNHQIDMGLIPHQDGEVDHLERANQALFGLDDYDYSKRRPKA